jgi:hypothetical protein
MLFMPEFYRDIISHSELARAGKKRIILKIREVQH